MDVARFISADEDRYITVNAESISPKQNEQIYRGNLYCEYENCNAQLVYNERQKGKFIRYFSTLKGSRHIDSCSNKIVHSGTRGAIIRMEGEDVNISDSHIKDVLDEAYKLFYNKLHPSKDEEKRPKRKRKKKDSTPIKDNEEAATIQIGGTPVTTGEGKTIVEGKEPYIYKKEVAEIQEKDKGTTKELHGIVENIRIKEEEAFVDLVGLDGSKFSVYIGTPFKTNCEQEFSLLHYFDQYIKKQKKENELVICTSVGEITNRHGLNVVQIFNYRHIKFDKLGFYQIVHLINSLAQLG